MQGHETSLLYVKMTCYVWMVITSSNQKNDSRQDLIGLNVNCNYSRKFRKILFLRPLMNTENQCENNGHSNSTRSVKIYINKGKLKICMA